MSEDKEHPHSLKKTLLPWSSDSKSREPAAPQPSANPSKHRRRGICHFWFNCPGKCPQAVPTLSQPGQLGAGGIGVIKHQHSLGKGSDSEKSSLASSTKRCFQKVQQALQAWNKMFPSLPVWVNKASDFHTSVRSSLCPAAWRTAQSWHRGTQRRWYKSGLTCPSASLPLHLTLYQNPPVF